MAQNQETTINFKPFDRIRRITGYLVGTTDRFNDGKKAEERERVKHGLAAAKQNNQVAC
jgi:anaerobic ribonucleoside-triphosphate reductase